MGVLYVLDEPSIGLHQRDNDRLLNTLEGLRDMGNTLIVVEHDEETMFRADYIADIGPGAGRNGGEVVAQGTVDQIMKCKNSLTGKSEMTNQIYQIVLQDHRDWTRLQARFEW